MAFGVSPGHDVLAPDDLDDLDRDPEAMASFAEAKALEATDFRLQKVWKALAAAWRRARRVHPVGSGTAPLSS